MSKMLSALKISIVFTLFIILFTGFSCAPISLASQQKAKSVAAGLLNSSDSKIIKSMTINGVKIGDLYGSALSSPTYELITAENKKKYINISGVVLLNKAEVVVLIQYAYNGKTATYQAMTYNDITQNNIEASSFFDYMYKEYNKTHKTTKAKVKPTPTPTFAPKKLLSEKECVQLFIKKVKAQNVFKKIYTSKDKKSYSIPRVEVDGGNKKTKKDNYYLIHYYEDVFNYPNDGHTATIGWYYISRTTGKICDTMGIDTRFPSAGDIDKELE
jgi:hypothetical protein